MAAPHWTLDDVPWDRFDRSKVDPALLPLVKAACLVERNGGDYARYLEHVFSGDDAFLEAARRWGDEEVQHGLALGRWAALADPSFDPEAASARFTAGFRVPLEPAVSVRGSRARELVARCIVETGTSSYYAALGEAAEEPVLKTICRFIAADEIRHYKLFHRHLERYAALERLSFWARLGIALGRIRETADDELSFAYHVANEAGAYDRRRSARAYGRRAAAVYRRRHAAQLASLVVKAVGLKRAGLIERAVAAIAWWSLRLRGRRAAEA
jgi:hypothetical protein